ncbi:hypothetical protein JYB64_11935 [Algoriphagus aestuarii]|nr:hypothetical protein [Algoriphagus aestuarii]
MSRKLLLFFIIGLFFSCKEDEKPRSGYGIISISGISLRADGTPVNQGQTSEENWIHKFEETLSIVFEHENGDTFQLTLDPNNFSKPYTIELPLGSINYSSNQQLGDFSETLPLNLSGEVQLIQARQNLILSASTDYGLLTLAKSNLAGKPVVISTNSNTFFESVDFYYCYIKDGIKTSTEISTSQPQNQFRILHQSRASQHDSKFILKEGETTSFEFNEIDFDIQEDKIILDNENKPIYLKPLIQVSLAQKMEESSGLARIGDRIFSINDGGNEAKIQELDPDTGELVREILVLNASNKDWEDMATSATHLYIGDFGNNYGTRKDLKILKIPISDLLQTNQVTASIIPFSYQDQVDFSSKPNSNNYDCESLFFLNGKLHLFTKNWENNKTRHYILEDKEEPQNISSQEELDTKGLITGADISADGKEIILLGYDNSGLNSQSFIWLLSDFTGTGFFAGKKRKTVLGSLAITSQTEGIVFKNEKELVISGERIPLGGLVIPAQLSELDVTGLF